MRNDFELKRRALVAYWQNIGEGAYRAAYEPSFNESYAEEDPDTGRVYIALKDTHGNFIKLYRYNTNKALKSLTRIPKFMRSTGQTVPFN
jgi:hypothetical protein